MPDKRLPKKILCGELEVGKRSHGGQKKRYKDTPKISLKTSRYQRYQKSRGNRLHRVDQSAGEYEAKKNAETCTAESQN